MKLALIFATVLIPFTSFSQMDSISHALGIVISSSVKQQGMQVNDYDAFLKGFKSGLEGETSPEDAQKAQMTLQSHMAKVQATQSEAAKSEGLAFLKKNAERKEVTTTASGLQYEVIMPGQGASPAASDKVTVHYTGTTIDGNVFDSSVKRGQPATFPLDGVIAGWTEGVQLMKPGAKYRFYIPSELAYGDRGAGADIPPGATLIFDVELISVN